MKNQDLEKKISYIKNFAVFMFFLFLASVLVFSLYFSASADSGKSFPVFFRENISLAFLTAVFFYVPVFWAKKREHPFPAALLFSLLFTALLAAVSVMLPHPGVAEPGSGIGEGSFYGSEKSVLFVGEISRGILEGIIVPVRSDENAKREALKYSGRFSPVWPGSLRLEGFGETFNTHRADSFRRFFAFTGGKASAISRSLGIDGLTDLVSAVIKSAGILFFITGLSFFASSVKWPLVNYFMSQTLLFVFLWANDHIQKIALPDFAPEAAGIFSRKPLFYYSAYLAAGFILIVMTSFRRALKK